MLSHTAWSCQPPSGLDPSLPLWEFLQTGPSCLGHTYIPLIQGLDAIWCRQPQDFFCQCTGVDISDFAWQQAQLSLSRGGLGLRSLVHHSSAAFITTVCSSGFGPSLIHHLSKLGHGGFQFFHCTSRLTFNLSPPCSILALSYPIWRLGAPPWPTNVPGSNQVVAGTFLKVRHNIHGEPSHVHYVLTVPLIVMAIMQSPASVEEIWLFATITQRFYSWNLSTSTYWSKDRGWPNLTTDHSRSRPADILILLPSWNMSKPAALEVKCCWLASCPVEDKNIC